MEREVIIISGMDGIFYARYMRQSILKVFRLLCIFLLFSTLSSGSVFAQEIDILLRGGHLIDAKNKINGRMDIAVSNGRIVKVSPSISSEKARKVIDLN